jgi:hypothetical protein
MPANIGRRFPDPACAILALALACDRTSPPSPSSTASPPPSATQLPRPAPDAAPEDVPDASAIACTKREGSVKLSWTDASYQLVLDGEALSCLSNAERAAVAYIGTTLGTDCDWVRGTDLSAPEHMDCKLTTALGLGNQCEKKHKDFLVEWFGEDIPAQCARIPITAYSQTALTELSLGHEGPMITVVYRATTTTGPGGKAWSWSETIVFQEKAAGALKIAYRKPVGKDGGR